MYNDCIPFVFELYYVFYWTLSHNYIASFKVWAGKIHYHVQALMLEIAVYVYILPVQHSLVVRPTKALQWNLSNTTSCGPVLTVNLYYTLRGGCFTQRQYAML